MRHNNFPANASVKARWKMLSAFRRNNITIVGKIISYNERYGYTVDIDGIKANLNHRDLTNNYIEDYNFYLDKEFFFNIVSVDIFNETAKISHKSYVNNLKKGQITHGVVTFKEGNRVFVDVGFIVRAIVPEQIRYNVGDTAIVMLQEDYSGLKYTKGTTSPYLIWKSNTENISVDQIIHVEVIGINPNGIVVSVSDYLDGFVHKQTFDKVYLNKFVNNEVEIGEYVDVAVTKLDDERKNIALSMKRVHEIPKERALNELKSIIEPGQIVEAIILDVSRTHADVQISGTEVVVSLNRNQLSKDKVIDARDVVFPGQVMNIVYIGEQEGQLIFDRKVLTDSIYPKEIYGLTLNELLANQGIDKNLFIGRAITMGEEMYFVDVASVGSKFDGQSFFEGRLLQDYFTARPSIVLINNRNLALDLIENGYYQFSISLASNKIRESQGSPFIYQTASNFSIKPVENPYRKEVELVFSKREDPEANKIIASLLRQVGSQMYSEKSRMLFELLQNADDAAPSRYQQDVVQDPKVHVLIDIRKNGILFQHNGCAFNFEDFRSITSAANSTKGVKKKSTGYKGIGFKSVFTNSKSVFIHSKGFQFWFDRNNPLFGVSMFKELYRKIRNISSEDEARKFFAKYAETEAQYGGTDDIPWQIMPFWDSKDELDDSLMPKINDNVIIGLIMNAASIDEYRAAIQEVFDNPRLFLFLRNTRRIQFNCFEQSIPQTIQKEFDTEKGIITLSQSHFSSKLEVYKLFSASDIVISNLAFEESGVGIRIKCEENNGIPKYSFVEFSDGTEGKKIDDIPDKIASADSTTISFAFSVDENDAIVPINSDDVQSSLYAYLPMNEQRFKFPFFINADFVLSSDRERLQADNRWNIFLFRQLGKQIVDAILVIANESNTQYLGLLPELFETNLAATRAISEAFNNSFVEAINTREFILDENGILRTQAEIALDKTGLSKIIGSELFRSILRIEKTLPYEELDVKPLYRPYFSQIESIEFDIVKQSLSQSDSFDLLNDWINSSNTDKKDVEKFYEWLLKHREQLNVQDVINNLAIIKIGNSFISSNVSNDTLILGKDAFAICDILEKLHISCNANDLSSHMLSDFIQFSKNTDVFERINETELSVLDYAERLRLFRTLEQLKEIGDAHLKKIHIFKSNNGKLISFEETYIVPNRLIGKHLPIWYNDCVISNDELCLSLTKYLPDTIKDSFNTAFVKFLSDKFTTIREFYDFFIEDEVWESSNTKQIIEKYGYSEEILFIVEKSGYDIQELFINKIDKFSLSSAKQYNSDTLEYRVLNMAVSSGNSQLLRGKTYIDDVQLSQYALSDSVTYTNNGKTYKLHLSDILPDFMSENALGVVMQMFSTIINIDAFFTQEEIDKNLLLAKFKKYITNDYDYLNWEQVAYVALEKGNSTNWGSYRNYMRIPSGDGMLNIFDQFIEQGWSELLKAYISEVTYITLTDIKGKYFESTEYTVPEERVSEIVASWLQSKGLHEERTNLLVLLGAFSSTSNEITRRKRFLGDISANADWNISSTVAINSLFNWIIKTQKLPLESQAQKDIIKELAQKAPRSIVKEYDFSRLSEAFEYDDDCYILWKKTSSISIYLINGDIPRVYKYNDIVLFGFEESSVDYVDSKKTIYVNSSCDIETEMMTMAGKYGVPFTKDNWSQLFSVNRSILKKEQDENTRLKEEIEQLKEQLSDDVAKRHQQGNRDEADQIELNRTSRYRAKEYLLSKGYNCENWDPEKPQAIYHTTKNGKEIAFAVASCRGGLIYLHTYKFAILMENPDNLLLIDDGNYIQSLSFKDAFQSNTNVNLIFDVDYVMPSSMAKIANMMQAFPKTRFVFEKPGYSISDEIRTFGLTEKHEGAAPIIETMDELD